MGSSVIFLLIGVLILAVVLVLYISLTRRESPQLNRDKYQAQWLSIENSLSRDNEAASHMAVLNADKLLDQALRDRRYKGEKMADRMKSAKSVWHNENHVWAAHKLRNQLAHEASVQVSYDTVLRALSAYKQALKDLGAI
jgi:hypothetical protein